MLSKTNCPHCAGTGVNIIQTSSLWGLMKREIPSTCGPCNGSGRQVELSNCSTCDGRGLVGNENEICRSCNGTGKVDSFTLIPLDLLVVGTEFQRRCDECGNTVFRIIGDLEQHKITKSWEDAEELRSVEIVDRVRVRCIDCTNSYYIPVDKAGHGTLEGTDLADLEALGLDLSFLYKLRPPKAQPVQPQV